ncbi:MAG: orotidine-5'-phosphate decarboxylase [Kiritimatiellae bacterium]|nr:orotidine-5'-phosphate decarboxylase [Kiritimatiellia bacterium]
MKPFEQRLSQRIAAVGSHLCIGLDPRPELIKQDVEPFLKQVIDETKNMAAAFKPNIAYFEALGSPGYKLLEELLAYTPDSIPVILDVKRCDIPETQRYYAKAYFENWDVDAITLNPFLGFDTVEPFLTYPGKGVYLLGRTSNKGASDFLTKKIEGKQVLEMIQTFVFQAHEYPTTIGMVMGLINLAEDIDPSLQRIPLLLPGFGAQGGALDPLKKTARHMAPFLINVSRGILYEEPDKTFEQKAVEYSRKIEGTLDRTPSSSGRGNKL